MIQLFNRVTEVTEKLNKIRQRLRKNDTKRRKAKKQKLNNPAASTTTTDIRTAAAVLAGPSPLLEDMRVGFLIRFS